MNLRAVKPCVVIKATEWLKNIVSLIWVFLFMCWNTSQSPLPKHAVRGHIMNTKAASVSYNAESVSTNGNAPFRVFATNRVESVTGYQHTTIINHSKTKIKCNRYETHSSGTGITIKYRMEKQILNGNIKHISANPSK